MVKQAVCGIEFGEVLFALPVAVCAVSRKGYACIVINW
jgi:hypothetical protein